MADLQYVATLDNKQVLAALKQIDAAITKQTSQASKDFQQLGKSASQSGVEIGAISGIVGSLTTAFINLGQQAVTALIDIGQQSVQTALEVDTLKARLGGIFDGSEEAADEAFGFIQAQSKELGIDLSELAGAFIPKTENLAQFERVAKIATALARSDPEQGAIGARIALIEALSGTFTSLQRRFEIPKDDINAIKAAFDKKGIEGFLETLETTLAASGKSFDDFKNTATTAFAKVQISGQQILGRLGTPIVESLEVAANKLNEFIGANEDDLIVFADTIGRAIADVIDLFSGLDFEGLDISTLQSIADYIFNIINALELAGGQFLALASTVTGTNDAGDAFYSILTNLDDALVTLAQIIALTNASFKAAQEGIRPYLKSLQALAEFATGDIPSGIVAITEALSSTTDLAAGQDAFSKSILESQKAFADYQSSVDSNKDSQQELREELEATAGAGTDAADAILAAGAAERQAAEDAQALEDAQAKVNEAMTEAQKDFDRKLEDIDIAFERKRLDIALEFAQKREDAARDHLQALEDIRRDYGNDVDDAATDLGRKEEDIARKFGEQRIDLEKEQRQKRLDVEKDYNRTLRDIQSQFLLDAEEAEQKRDAVAFIRALKERDKKVSEAQTDRQQSINDTKIEGELKREELRIQQERELEEAHIANERKLEDLRENLNRQIEEQNTAYARQLEDLAIGEQRKIDEANTARERDIEDARKAYDRKLEDLQTSLAAELEIIKAGNAAIEEEAARHAAALGEIEASAPSTTAGASAGFGANPGTISTGNAPSTTGGASAGLGDTPDEFATGGTVPGPKGKPRMIIAHGGEVIIPTNSPLLMPVGGGGGGNSYTFNNQKSASLGGLLDAGSLDALLTSKIENVLLSVLNKVS